MTSSITDVLKEDLKTPADAFDMGAGRVDVGAATGVTLTLDETKDNFAAKGGSALTAVDLNIPSVDATTMPGALRTTRTVTNVSSRTQQFRVSTAIQRDSRIRVSPSAFTLRPGKAQRLTVTLSSDSPLGSQRFGSITITPRKGAALHLPVAFVHTQGDVSLTQTCAPDTIKQLRVSTCTVTAANQSFADQTVKLKTTAKHLLAVGASGAKLNFPVSASTSATLTGAKAGTPSVAPGAGPGGFIPLDLFGIAPTPVGDEQILSFNVAAFVFNGKTYTSIGVDSNGYVIAGDFTSADNECCHLPSGPSSAPPNNVLAPFWTDLDGTGAPGVFAGTLTDGVNTWFVIEHRVNVFGTTSQRDFQTWIGVHGTQDISYAYDPSHLPADPNGQPFLVGAENEFGQGDMRAVLPTEDLVVTSTTPVAGQSVTYSVQFLGVVRGRWPVTTELRAPTVPGVTLVRSDVVVTKW